MADLNGINDFRELTIKDVNELYEFIIPSLKETTKPPKEAS